VLSLVLRAFRVMWIFLSRAEEGMIMSIILCKFCFLHTGAWWCSIVSDDHKCYRRQRLVRGVQFLSRWVLKLRNLVKPPDEN